VISFEINIPTAAPANFNQIIPNWYCPWFNRIELYTSSGNTYLVNQQQADIYSRLACPLNNDFKTRSEEMGPMAISKRIEGVGWDMQSPAANGALASYDPYIILLNNNTTI
jgi:hypothetical protein